MSDFNFEASHLLLKLGVTKSKTFVLRLKIGYFLFKQRVLIIRKRNSLTKYRGRAMLSNEAFNTVEKSHCDTSNVK